MRQQFRHRARQDGFTLIELMVSMVLGLLIVLALITVLINVNRNNSELDKTNRLIENGRIGLQLLKSDLSHAAYWGGFVPQFDELILSGVPADFPSAVPDPCLPYTSPWTAAYKANLIGLAVQGYEIPAVVPSPTLAVCAGIVLSPQANTDVVVVRHVEPCVPGVGNCPAVVAGELYLQVARCGSVTPSPAYVLDSDALLFSLQNRDCATVAELRKFVSNLYYVRNYAVTAGDGIPTLMRSRFGLAGGSLAFQPAEVLIEGIEGFRVEYGIDTLSDSGAWVDFGAAITWADASTKTSPTNRGDGVPDGNYVRCTAALPCTVNQLANVVAAKVFVLVRSERATPGYVDDKTYQLGSTALGTPLGPFNDGFKRHLFSQAVRLTNIAARRETP